MLKGLEMNGLRAAAPAKSPLSAPVRKSALVTARAPASKHHQAFKNAQRPAVRASAAEPEATASPQTQRRQRGLPLEQCVVGDEYEGRVTKVEQFGAFVEFGFAKAGLVHISQLSDKFIKSAASVVQPNQTVKVRVMSVDAAAGRIALSMKGMSAAESPDAEEDAEEDFEEEGAEAGDEDADMSDVLLMEAPEGYEFVNSPEEPEMTFLMEEDDKEMTLESVAAFEALSADEIEREIQSDVVPVGEMVSGKVTRVEDYGAFIEFPYNGKTFTALLSVEEAKAPASALSKQQMAEFTEPGQEAPEWVDFDMEDNFSKFFTVGLEVPAFVLEYNQGNKMALTQFADWEVQQAAGEIDNEEADMLLAEVELDTLAEDPLDLLEQESSAASDSAEVEYAAGSEQGDILNDYATMTGYSRPLTNQDISLTFPSRPLNRVNTLALNQLGFQDTDFDGDEITLSDYWQETFQVPKHALKRLGLRIRINENGEPDVVEKEGATAGNFDPRQALHASHNARVAAFVKDLMADDEDEAEVPARAMRRPVVMMTTVVQNISATAVKDLRNKTGAGMMDCKKALAENEGDVDKAIEWLRKKGLAGADKKAGRVAAEGVIAQYIHPGSRLGVLLEVNCETDFVAASDKFQSLVGELGMIIASCPDVIVVSPEDVPAELLAKEREVEMGKEDIKSKPEAVRTKIVEGRIQKIRDNMALLNQSSLRDPNKNVTEIIKESIAAIGENIQVRRFVRYKLGEGLEKRSNDFAAEVAQQTQAMAAAPAAPKKEEPKKEEPKAEAAKPAVQISASVVKELRDKTGAGMMDCKKALAENGGNMDASVEWLRKKGLASADKKAGRLAAEGVIAQYIHPGSRLGVLLEVNCETDFVAASEKFNALVQCIAMQIAASPTVLYVTAEDIPPEVYAREKEIEMGREDLKNKPDAIRAKIAEGRVAKLAQEMALLPQPYLMDPSKTVEQAVKEAVAAIGEKISVRRFVKYQLGEGIEKKVSNLADDVAAATGAKA